MKSVDIRSSFVDFFQERGHRAVHSAPLVPHGDPTLLFTNAGMVQFKDLFLGLEKADYKRAVSVQKCLRVSGKHNDLENVGPSPRHHTFFEMLGNFSFGDYFKEEAIRFGWDLVTRVWGLPEDRLFATVFEDDDDAEKLWLKHSSLPRERVLRCSAKDNFWAMGETGPCGPCSEIFVDRAPHLPEVDWEEGSESGRYLEIWNLVFMQFSRDDQGKMTPLPNPSIDTGAGLERVAAVLQNVESNYDTDLFQPLLGAAAERAGIGYGENPERDTALRVVGDHLRSVTFLLGDGVIPGNEGRGYVLRRLLRRAVRHGMRLGFEEPFLNSLVPVVREVMGDAYPELVETEEATVHAVLAEEEKFLGTLAAGSRQVQESIEAARQEGRAELSGEAAFRLYDTHGLPLELLLEIAEEERFGVDEEGFLLALEKQRNRSRDAAGGSQHKLEGLREALGTAATEFVGYDRLQVADAQVLALARLDEVFAGTDSLAAGDRGAVALDRTPFYAESGGQVADSGELTWPGGGRAEVTDVQRDPSGLIVHLVTVMEGQLESRDLVSAMVDADLRRDTERNHTATHLLHAALRAELGEGVRQAGSLVHPDRLRFDFTFGRPLTEEEKDQTETRVSQWVWRSLPVDPKLSSRDDALEAGAMALFGEKYGDEVRTVAVGDVSLELCGGCHVGNSGEIGPFVLLSERGIASGVRRVEALTGRGAFRWLRDRRRLVLALEEELGAPAHRLDEEVQGLKAKLSDQEKEAERLRRELATGGGEGDQVVKVQGLSVVAKEVPPAPVPELRRIVDVLRQKLRHGVVVVGAREGEKVTLLAGVEGEARERVHAGKLVGELAGPLGGKGGGRPDFAQAGGRKPELLKEVLESVPGVVESMLG